MSTLTNTRLSHILSRISWTTINEILSVEVYTYVHCSHSSNHPKSCLICKWFHVYYVMSCWEIISNLHFSPVLFPPPHHLENIVQCPGLTIVSCSKLGLDIPLSSLCIRGLMFIFPKTVLYLVCYPKFHLNLPPALSPSSLFLSSSI